jgi:uncharacterized protein (DUF4415 family)
MGSNRTDPGATPDDENPEWSAADFARARPASELLGAEAAALLVRTRGRPAIAPAERKQQVGFRWSPSTIEALKRTGAGWQARAEEMVREGLGDSATGELRGRNTANGARSKQRA